MDAVHEEKCEAVDSHASSSSTAAEEVQQEPAIMSSEEVAGLGDSAKLKAQQLMNMVPWSRSTIRSTGSHDEDDDENKVYVEALIEEGIKKKREQQRFSAWSSRISNMASSAANSVKQGINESTNTSSVQDENAENRRVNSNDDVQQQQTSMRSHLPRWPRGNSSEVSNDQASEQQEELERLRDENKKQAKLLRDLRDEKETLVHQVRLLKETLQDQVDEMAALRASVCQCQVEACKKDADEFMRVRKDEYHSLQAKVNTSLIQSGDLAHRLAQSRSESDELQERLKQTELFLTDSQSELEASRKKTEDLLLIIEKYQHITNNSSKGGRAGAGLRSRFWSKDGSSLLGRNSKHSAVSITFSEGTAEDAPQGKPEFITIDLDGVNEGQDSTFDIRTSTV